MIARSTKITLSLYALLVVYYCSISYYFGFDISEETMFLATDAKEYREVSQWLSMEGDTMHTLTRPVLYPALIALPYKVAGIYGIWLLQFLAWLASAQLIFNATQRITQKTGPAIFAVALLLLHPSTVALTYHALTETAILLGFALLASLLARFYKDYMNPRFAQLLAILLIAMALIKPVFYYPALLVLLLSVLVYFRKRKSMELRPWLIVLGTGLLLLQMCIVQVKHDRFTFSAIGQITFTKYLVTQGMASLDHAEFDVTQQKVLNMEPEAQMAYVKKHKDFFIPLFWDNVKNNIKGEPVYIDLTSKKSRPWLRNEIWTMNQRDFSLHVYLFIFLAITVPWLLFKRRWNEFIPLLVAGALLYYYLLTTGISFWQGDRLTLPAVGIWSVFYVILLYFIGKTIRSKVAAFIQQRKK